MEGVLWKWTNYWNGWQMRWFVLQDGILSYYMSAEEVNQGCKGSMKVSALEINVNSSDPTRMDLSIPGEKNIYLRASSPQERQQWLVALGSSKASLTNNNKKESISDPNLSESLRSKKSELRLYCDLLMQQVHLVKTAASQNSVDIEKLNEGSSLLPATCDTFIKTLEECMKMSSNLTCLEQPINNISKPTIPPVIRSNSGEKKT